MKFWLTNCIIINADVLRTDALFTEEAQKICQTKTPQPLLSGPEISL